jgi:Kef-type K+ transport system membrane component KefB
MDNHAMFVEAATVLALAAGVGLLGLAFKQPLIVGFLAVGILAGPNALGIVQDGQYIQLLSEVGVAVLLFVVGLKLDIKLVRTLGTVAVATGLGQVLFTAAVGFLLCLLLGQTPLTAIYVAVALTFSSTIIIVKLLSDKREVDSLHGRIALGFLIVQDLAVVFAMIALSTLGVGAASGDASPWLALGNVLGGGVVLLVGLAIFMRFAAERVLRIVVRVPELMVTFAVAWAVGLAVITHAIGLGAELGGLFAGVAFASTSYRDAVASRLGPLRDFLLLFFFVGLGLQLDLGVLGAQVPSSLVLSAFVLVGNPLIVLIIMGVMGYRARTGFLAGLTVAQISEFSLIFMAMGMSIGHVEKDAMGLVTLVGLITITLSTYMILYSQPLYRVLAPLLRPFERKVAFREEAADAEIGAGERCDVIVVGLGRYGTAMARNLELHGLRVMGADVDPEAVGRWAKEGRKVIFGDASDPGLVEDLPLGAGVRWAVIAIPPYPTGLAHADPRYALLEGFKTHPHPVKLAVIARDDEESKQLQALGADIVLQPLPDAAVRAVERMLDLGDRSDGAPAPASGGLTVV